MFGQLQTRAGFQLETGTTGDNQATPAGILETSRKAMSLSWAVDHDFTQGLQHLPLVILEVTINLADTLLLHHPQLAVGFCDKSGIMADNNHSCGERGGE